MKETFPKMKWNWWLQTNFSKSVLCVENMDTKERLAGKSKTTRIEAKARNTMAAPGTSLQLDTKTATNKQDNDCKQLEHQKQIAIAITTNSYKQLLQ